MIWDGGVGGGGVDCVDGCFGRSEGGVRERGRRLTGHADGGGLRGAGDGCDEMGREST